MNHPSSASPLKLAFLQTAEKGVASFVDPLPFALEQLRFQLLLGSGGKMEITEFVALSSPPPGENLFHSPGTVLFSFGLASPLSLEQCSDRIEMVGYWKKSNLEVTRVRVKKTGIVDVLFPQRCGPLFPQFTPEHTLFRVFAPLAQAVNLGIFAEPDAFAPSMVIPMQRNANGTWSVQLEGNHHGTFYRYFLQQEGEMVSTIDPYSHGLSVNSQKSVILDPEFCQVPGWETDRRVRLENPVDAVVYETHVRDFTAGLQSWGCAVGKFLSTCKQGLSLPSGESVGFDHLLDLGVTHVHFLPLQDFGSVDETHPSDYNWGYDPVCFTVPEGSYSSDPHDPVCRIREMKSMIHSFHRAGIGVILDVVYNHTYQVQESHFQKTVPDYFYRFCSDGSFSNGSGCGNEVATERIHVRDFLYQTLRFWLEQYHVDGFRFDLMGLFDRDGMEEIAQKLHEDFPGMLAYGEPWTGGQAAIPDEKRCSLGFQKNTQLAVFGDRFRDALKGRPDDGSPGFIQGDLSRTWDVARGLLGDTLALVSHENPVASAPAEMVHYVSCHDNLSLRDKLQKVQPGRDIFSYLQAAKAAFFLLFLSQGIPFLQAGSEFFRTKMGHANPYNASDFVNAIRWEQKHVFQDLTAYVKGLISLRKQHSLFRMRTGKEVAKRMRLVQASEGIIQLALKGSNGDDWQRVQIIVNFSLQDVSFSLASGEWRIFANPLVAGSLCGIVRKHLVASPASWYLCAM
ncbi:MAG TPA: type I pullulanase [Thermotogota bacterium]|nr:type I pullulanase [Thermotogota bacterium]